MRTEQILIAKIRSVSDSGIHTAIDTLSHVFIIHRVISFSIEVFINSAEDFP